jgi:hypothetical protein
MDRMEKVFYLFIYLPGTPFFLGMIIVLGSTGPFPYFLETIRFPLSLFDS